MSDLPTPTPQDPAEALAFWQKRLAAQANNRAWALAEQTTRSADEDEAMLHAAHAAMHGWRAVGTPRNHAHAALLLAHVYALLKLPHPAQHHQAQSDAFFSQAENAPWETAFILAIGAHVAAVTGHAEAHRTGHQQAVAAIDALDDPEDRAILLKTLRVIPVP